MSEDKTFITWDDILLATEQLKELIQEEQQTPDAIVAIGRGGLIPGTLLAYKLDVKTVVNYTIQSYSGENRQTESFNIIQKLDDAFLAEFKVKRVLIVDDLSDTGNTFAFLKEQLSTLNNVQYCSLYIKTGTTVVPDYYITEFDAGTWLVFPWELS